MISNTPKLAKIVIKIAHRNPTTPKRIAISIIGKSGLQYIRLLELDEVSLRFEEDALEWIAEEAMKKETGARALRSILEEFMLDIMYEIPKDPGIGSVVITRSYLEKKGAPGIEMRSVPS